jgi:hypothetical protein
VDEAGLGMSRQGFAGSRRRAREALVTSGTRSSNILRTTAEDVPTPDDVHWASDGAAEISTEAVQVLAAAAAPMKMAVG